MRPPHSTALHVSRVGASQRAVCSTSAPTSPLHLLPCLCPACTGAGGPWSGQAQDLGGHHAGHMGGAGPSEGLGLPGARLTPQPQGLTPPSSHPTPGMNAGTPPLMGMGMPPQAPQQTMPLRHGSGYGMPGAGPQQYSGHSTGSGMAGVAGGMGAGSMMQQGQQQQRGAYGMGASMGSGQTLSNTMYGMPHPMQQQQQSMAGMSGVAQPMMASQQQQPSGQVYHGQPPGTGMAGTGAHHGVITPTAPMQGPHLSAQPPLPPAGPPVHKAPLHSVWQGRVLLGPQADPTLPVATFLFDCTALSTAQ